MKRKHISWKTKYAAALLALGDIPYAHAREMTKDQIISLYHIDHGILHETENENVDQWWNLTPKLIQAHREKTKADAKIIAKSRRIRKKQTMADAMAEGIRSAVIAAAKTEGRRTNPWFRKLHSRGFNKTLRKKMDGTVVKR
jgi:hypothetical protein